LKHLLLILVILISGSAFGQGDNRTATLLDSFLSVDKLSANSASSFNTFLNKLEKKHSSIKDEDDFVHHLFMKTHQQYLKKYEAYASIGNLFNNGSYNCLTGTILYTLLLDHFQISHRVIETNYHIFILVETKQGEILLEATDPLNGFVANPLEIESRINTYKENLIQASSSKAYAYQFNFELFNQVSIKELRGLLYYNKSVDAYNHQNLQASVQYLVEANMLYTSSRIDEFSQILLLTLQQSKLDSPSRTECIKTVLSIKRDFTPAVALLN